jgi:hypothetical protein
VLSNTDQLSDEVRISLAPVLTVPAPKNKDLLDRFWALRTRAEWSDVEDLVRSGAGGETCRSHAVRRWRSRVFGTLTEDQNDDTDAWAIGILQALKENTDKEEFGNFFMQSIEQIAYNIRRRKGADISGFADAFKRRDCRASSCMRYHRSVDDLGEDKLAEAGRRRGASPSKSSRKHRRHRSRARSRLEHICKV